MKLTSIPSTWGQASGELNITLHNETLLPISPHPSQGQVFKNWPHIRFSFRKAVSPLIQLTAVFQALLLTVRPCKADSPYFWLVPLAPPPHCSALHTIVIVFINGQGVYCIHHLFPKLLTVPSIRCSINICWSSHLTHPVIPQLKANLVL